MAKTLWTQILGFFILELHHYKRRYVMLFFLLALPWAVIAYIVMTADLLGKQYTQTHNAYDHPVAISQRWSKNDYVDRAPLNNDMSPAPFTVLYAQSAGTDVGTLPRDPTVAPSGTLANIATETTSIHGIRSPHFKAMAEDDIDPMLLRVWLESFNTLGGAVFDASTPTNLTVNYLTNDTSDGSVIAGTGESELLLGLTDLVANAWMSGIDPAGGYVEHSVKDFPRAIARPTVDFFALGQIEPIGLALHAALPFALAYATMERVSGRRAYTAAMGLHPTVAHLVPMAFITAVVLCACVSLYIAGALFNLALFTRTNLLTMGLLFIVWSFSVSSQAALLAPLLPSVRAAVIVGAILVVLMNNGAITAVYLAVHNRVLNPFVWVPSVAFHQALDVLSRGSELGGAGVGLDAGWSFYIPVVYLLISSPVIATAAVLLDKAWPAMSRRVSFAASASIAIVLRYTVQPALVRQYLPARVVSMLEVIVTFASRSRARELTLEEAHVTGGVGRVHPSLAEEKARAAAPDAPDQSAVVLRDVTKITLQSDGMAFRPLDHVSLTVPAGSVLAVMGPAKAGKSTLLEVMAGVHMLDGGSVTLGGLNARHPRHQARVRRMTSICPQHDLLWPDLTPLEHLMFFGRLRGLVGKQLRAEAAARLAEFGLGDVAADPTKTIPAGGGARRRLSVAISLIGDPEIVFMDEPTTGLDPASRRALWQSIRDAQGIRTFVLTTHSMEEAEALGNQVAIMANGRLKCMASPDSLKAFYGTGYRLVVTGTEAPAGEDPIARRVEAVLPESRLVRSMYGTRVFQVPVGSIPLAELFSVMEDVRLDDHVEDWAVTDTTLDQVYALVTNQDGPAGEGSVTVSPAEPVDDDDPGEPGNGEEPRNAE